MMLVIAFPLVVALAVVSVDFFVDSVVLVRVVVTVFMVLVFICFLLYYHNEVTVQWISNSSINLHKLHGNINNQGRRR